MIYDESPLLISREPGGVTISTSNSAGSKDRGSIEVAWASEHFALKG